jgi:tetratricopeptide (TPR) repeat protein
MGRLFLFWYPWHLRRCLGFAVIGAVFASIIFAAEGPPVVALTVLGFLTALPLVRLGWWLSRFGLRIRGFRSLAERGVLLHCAPAVSERVDLGQFVEWCEQALQELGGLFEGSLKRRLAVFLFANVSEISRFFKTPMGACALVGGDAIVVATDALLAMKNPQELVRHEIAHLLSRRWGRLEPPFKCEGLATWAQGSLDGKSIDFAALTDLISNACLPLWSLVPHATFYRDRQSHYALAGSFTGFLIRQFGQATYRRWFRAARPRNFEAAFERIFGLTLTAAERRWRHELLARRQEFEPELSVAAREQIVLSSYGNHQFVRCLDESDALIQAGKGSAIILWTAACAHGCLGNYEEGIKLFKQLLQMDDGWAAIYRGWALIAMGQFYDLQAQRREAVEAYERALQEPDSWYWGAKSSHRLARRYLAKPFTEQILTAQSKAEWKKAMQAAQRRRT